MYDKFAICIIICTYVACPIPGQVFSPFVQDCNLTCSDPYKDCGELLVETCHCPEGTVLDEIQKKCVPISKCSKIKHSIAFTYNLHSILLTQLQDVPHYVHMCTVIHH